MHDCVHGTSPQDFVVAPLGKDCLSNFGSSNMRYDGGLWEYCGREQVEWVEPRHIWGLVLGKSDHT